MMNIGFFEVIATILLQIITSAQFLYRLPRCFKVSGVKNALYAGILKFLAAPL